jgi:hypothetical protein
VIPEEIVATSLTRRRIKQGAQVGKNSLWESIARGLIGKTLWRVPLNATIKTSPMTFAVGGQQFIALAVGSNIVCFGL